MFRKRLIPLLGREGRFAWPADSFNCLFSEAKPLSGEIVVWIQLNRLSQEARRMSISRQLGRRCQQVIGLGHPQQAIQCQRPIILGLQNKSLLKLVLSFPEMTASHQREAKEKVDFG